MRKNDKKTAKKNAKKNAKKTFAKKTVKKIEMVSGTQAVDVVNKRLTEKDRVSIVKAMHAFGNYINCKKNASDDCRKLSFAEIVDSAGRMEKALGDLADLFIDYDANLYSFTGSMISQTTSETLGYFKELVSLEFDEVTKNSNASIADEFYAMWENFEDLTYSLVYPLVLTIFHYHHISLGFDPAQVEDFLIYKHLVWRKSLMSIENKWINAIECSSESKYDKAKTLIEKANNILEDHLITVNGTQVEEHINARMVYLGFEDNIESSMNHEHFVNGIKDLGERLAEAALDFKAIADAGLAA